MAAGENAENWLETKLERCYPELQPEIIEELVQAVTPEMPYSLLGPNPPPRLLLARSVGSPIRASLSV